jgi:CRP/FNR family cyclic AMP-dependent transcriptional regulator
MLPSSEERTRLGQSIERFLELCHRRHLPAKALIMAPGDPADTLYYLIEGAASVELATENGNEMVLAYLNAGDFIGEIGVFLTIEDERGVSVRTRTPCQVAGISYERLRRAADKELMDAYPDILYVLGRQLSERLLRSHRKVESLAFDDVVGRIEQVLGDLCAEPDALTHAQGIQVKVSRQELSRIAGCSREKAGQALKRLEEQGKLGLDGKMILVYREAKNPPSGP